MRIGKSTANILVATYTRHKSSEKVVESKFSGAQAQSSQYLLRLAPEQDGTMITPKIHRGDAEAQRKLLRASASPR